MNVYWSNGWKSVTGWRRNSRNETCPITDGFESLSSGSDMDWPGIEIGASRWEASDRDWTMALQIWRRKGGNLDRVFRKLNISYLTSNGQYFGYCLSPGSKTEAVRNSIQEEIKSRLKSGNAWYHSVQNLLSSSLQYKNLKIKVYRTKILPVVLYGCETWSLTLREERRLKLFWEYGVEESIWA